MKIARPFLLLALAAAPCWSRAIYSTAVATKSRNNEPKSSVIPRNPISEIKKSLDEAKEESGAKSNPKPKPKPKPKAKPKAKAIPLNPFSEIKKALDEAKADAAAQAPSKPKPKKAITPKPKTPTPKTFAPKLSAPKLSPPKTVSPKPSALKPVKSSPSTVATTKTSTQTPGLWPCMDELDKRLIMISIPMIINFSITPLVGASDLFWTNRMGNALAVAGQAAATQVFNSGFWLASFLPSVTSTLVSKENAKGNKEGVQDSVCQALFVAILIAVGGTALFSMNPDKTLGAVLKGDAPAMKYAKQYLGVRSFSFLPALIALVGFSAFRGILDVKTPFMISLMTAAINCFLDPICIFGFGLGIKGNALSTLLAEVVSAVVFLKLMIKKDLIRASKIFKLPSWAKLLPLIKGGFAMQLRLIAFNITFIAVARVTQGIDKTGVAAAAHEMALQTFQLGGVVLMALSVVAQIVIPNELHSATGGPKAARATSNRMMSWGLILGTALGGLQILVLPLIQKATPMPEVRMAARAPAILASVLQTINAFVFIGEGVMSGCGDFLHLAISTIVATAGCLMALQYFPEEFGLTGVWMSFGVFNILRLLGVIIHQFRTSAIAPRKLKNA